MKYVIKKIIALIITLFIVSLLAFLAFEIVPGDPAIHRLGTNATPEAIAALREEMGLNQPMIIRYVKWIAGFLHGDFGTSYTYSVPVRQLLADKLPITAVMTLISFVITIILSIPLGILAGGVKSVVGDRIVTIIDQIFMSAPGFFVGMFICYICGLIMKLFTPGQFVALSTNWKACVIYLIYPSIAIAIPRIAMTVKMLRGSILNELGKDYCRTALSRGNSFYSTLNHHVLRNAMIPVITFLAISLTEIMTGTIIIEQVFSIPGVGRLLIASISNRDYPIVEAIVVILAAWIVVINFLGDILNQYVDPRMRLR